MLSKEELIQLALASFETERTSDVAKNLTYFHEDFAVTDMVFDGKDDMLPRVSGGPLRTLMSKAFIAEGRESIFPTVVADEEAQTVIVESVESYPDPKTGKIYRTSQIAVCKIKDCKLFRTRYCIGPRLSHERT